MSNGYYNRLHDYTPYTTARGETLSDEFEGIELGFDRIDAAFKEVVSETGTSVRFSAGDLGTGVISANAAQRAGKVQAFDAAGLATVIAPGDIDGLNGVRAMTFALHGFTLPAHGFVPVNRQPGGIAAATADAHEHAATACIVAVPDVNTVRLAQRGFIRVPGHGLTPGTVYFLSQTGTGITPVQPAMGVIQPLAEVWSVDDILLLGAMPTVKA